MNSRAIDFEDPFDTNGGSKQRDGIVGPGSESDQVVATLIPRGVPPGVIASRPQPIPQPKLLPKLLPKSLPKPKKPEYGEPKEATDEGDMPQEDTQKSDKDEDGGSEPETPDDPKHCDPDSRPKNKPCPRKPGKIPA